MFFRLPLSFASFIWCRFTHIFFIIHTDVVVAYKRAPMREQLFAREDRQVTVDSTREWNFSLIEWLWIIAGCSCQWEDCGSTHSSKKKVTPEHDNLSMSIELYWIWPCCDRHSPLLAVNQVNLILYYISCQNQDISKRFSSKSQLVRETHPHLFPTEHHDVVICFVDHSRMAERSELLAAEE